MEVLKTYRLWILKAILLLQVALLTFWFYTAVGDGKYFIQHEDEVINYCASKLYAETGSVRAEGCITEDVSPIGEMNWYGPGYHFVYGNLVKVFGGGDSRFIQFHFAFVLLTLMLIGLYPTASENRWLIANGLAFCWPVTVYTFSYFPEALNLFMASILTLLLFRIDQRENFRQRKSYVFAFIILVMVFALCRITIIFWLAALIGLSTSKKGLITTTLIFITGVVVALVYMKFFTAPPFASGMHKIDKLYQRDMLDFMLKTGSAALGNIWDLIFSKSLPVYLLLALVGVNVYYAWKTRTTILIAAGLVSIVLLLALMAYYTWMPWFFLKQSCNLMPLLLAAPMAAEINNKVKYALVVMLLTGFCLSYSEVKNAVHGRLAAHNNLVQFEAFRTSLQEIPEYIDEREKVTILWCYNEYPMGNTAEALLPFSTRFHQPILYTTNIVNSGDSPEVKFQLHNKLKVGYVLSRQSIELPLLKEVHTTEFYHLYKIIDNKK